MVNWLYNLIHKKCLNEQEELQKAIDISINLNNDLRDQVAELNIKLDELNKLNPKEEELNNKYPKVNLTYSRKETDGEYQIDLRDFILIDNQIPVVNGQTDDEKALEGLKWVINNIKYVSDDSDSTYKTNEYWAYPYQTLKHLAGDCEDGAILLACILIKSGVPYWKIRLHAGMTPFGGHAYLNFYCEEQDKWKTLDWCYYPTIFPIKDRIEYKENKLYGEVWFSWNQKYCFSTGTKTGFKRVK